MDDRLLKYFVDSRTSKILLDILRSGRITIRELCANIPDVPRSTMYRILTKMEREGFVKVVDYKQKRGTVEKTYAPTELLSLGPDPLRMTSDDISVLFMTYCMEFANQFREYSLKHPGTPDPKNGTFGYWLAPVYATDRELEVLIENFSQQMSRYSMKDPTGERKLHSVGLIVSPPAERADGQD